MSTLTGGNPPIIRLPAISRTAFTQKPIAIPGATVVPLDKISSMREIDEILRNIAIQISAFTATQVLRKTAVTRTITFSGGVSQQIILGKSLKGYIIKNAAVVSSAGMIEGTLSDSVVVSGAGQSNEVSVGNFLYGHFWLRIEAVSINLDLDWYLQANGPFSGYADVKLLFPVSETGMTVQTFYKYTGQEGIAQQLRFRHEVVAGAGTVTFSLGYVFKGPLGGNSLGSVESVYLGPNRDVNTTSGFPLLEGESFAVFLEDGAELWGVTETDVTLNIFELQ